MTIHSSIIFFYSTLSFLVGVTVRSFFTFDVHFLYNICVILGVVFIIAFYREKFLLASVLWISCLVFGVLWADLAIIDAQSHTMLNGQKVEFAGKVVKEPVQRTKGKNVTVEILQEHKCGFLSKAFHRCTAKKALLKVSRHADIMYGDKLQFSCTLETPERFDEKFDYRMYLAKDRIYYICNHPTYTRIAYTPGYTLVLIGALRKKMETHINRAIPQPQAALANGLLFGGDDRLSEEIQGIFSTTGMTHIVAVSGYNVTVIVHVLTIVGIALGLWRRQAIWVAMGGILFFIAMIGFPASGVRAAIMGILVLFAVQYGRSANALGAILFAGALMLIFNPLLLRYDVGFQLSFLATLGLILFYPLFDAWFVTRAKMMGLTEIICLTLCAQFFVLPVIFYNFETFSIVSLLANTLVLLIVPLSMLFSFLTAVLGFVSATLATLTGWMAYILLTYEISVIEALSKIPWASVPVTWMQPWHAVVYYVVLLMVIFVYKQYEKNKNDGEKN